MGRVVFLPRDAAQPGALFRPADTADDIALARGPVTVRHVGGFPGEPGCDLVVELVPRRGFLVEHWAGERELSCLRLVASGSVRYLESYPSGWYAMDPWQLAELWRRAAPARPPAARAVWDAIAAG